MHPPVRDLGLFAAIASLKLRRTSRPSDSLRARAPGDRAIIAELAEFFDHLIECCLCKALDRLDDRHFEMELFIRRPFHAAFGGGKLLDQLEQTYLSKSGPRARLATFARQDRRPP